MKLRIKFSKYGPIRYIGHLDVMRFFQKAVRRAEIDVTYTKGFSPHQVMSFAAPLSVGLTSVGEYMDLEVNSLVSCEDIKDRLNAASVPGIEVLSVKCLPDNAKNAMASVAAAKYQVSFKEGKDASITITQDMIKEFLSKEKILYTKESKKGERELDLKEGIYEFYEEDGNLYMILDASSAGNIKPIHVMDALLSDHNETLQENALAVHRLETYMNDGDEENRHLVPLDAIGTTNIPVTVEENSEQSN